MPTWRSFGVYKIDINQGNYLSQDMVDKLKVGMTQPQVKQCSARRSSRRRFAPTAGITSTSTRARAGSSSTATSPSISPTARSTRWEGDEMPESVVELNRSASAKALPSNAPGEKSAWDRFLDVFRK